MQPILLIRAQAPGMLYINGRFAGEVSSQPLSLPCAANAPVYLQYLPFVNNLQQITRKLELSGGYLSSGADNINIIEWPGGLIDVEFISAEQEESASSASSAGSEEINQPPGALREALLSLRDGDTSSAAELFGSVDFAALRQNLGDFDDVIALKYHSGFGLISLCGETFARVRRLPQEIT